jgi:acetylglutamate kinase
MKAVIEKAQVLIEALPYIQQFRDALVVIKFGGSAMEDKACYDSILTDITFMACVGMKPVIVHGGGKAITRRMQSAGVRPVFVKGLRVTDEAAMRIVAEVLAQDINPGIVAALVARGARARGIQGQTILRARKLLEKNDETGETVDLGFVGTVTAVTAKPIQECLAAGDIPVITPVGLGTDNALYNINADDVAAAVARALKARKLVFLSDIPGLLKNPGEPDSVISTLKMGQVEGLVRKKVIDGGMLPKIRGGVAALQAGVRKVHIVDGRLSHSLLLEIFTDKGVGTEIISDDEERRSNRRV